MTPAAGSLEQILLPVLLQLAVILASARIMGAAFRRLGQPQVCGEIAAGLLLGPTFLGGFFPSAFAWVFPSSGSEILSLLSQIGLILLMFLIGLEFDFSHLRGHARASAAVSAAGIVVPFGLGLLLGRLLHTELGIAGNRLHFSLFIATALSITAIPVLGRIMLELNIARTRLGSLTITAAAIDDVAGWTLLALVTAAVRSESAWSHTAAILGSTAVYAVFVFLAARPLLVRWSRSVLRRGQRSLSHQDLAVLLVMVLLSAAITNSIGISAIFGGFLLGAAMHGLHDFREAVRRRMFDFVTVFFLPIFFTYTGLRTDAGSLSGAWQWGLCALVLAAAIAGKFAGCAAAGLLSGMSLRDASIVGTLMNTRGLMALIVINAGFELGVIPKTVYFMLVTMAVATTYMTVPILLRLMKKSELEEHFRQSEFARSAL
jgi:Kef-type K+ transport system membrane component KefB